MNMQSGMVSIVFNIFTGIFLFILMCFILEDICLRKAETKREDTIADNRKENEALRLQLKMYQRQLGVMAEQNDAGRILRHDMKHHIRMLTDYIREGESAKALAYMKKMKLYADGGREWIRSGNEDVDSILNYFMEETDKIGGNATIDVKIVQKLFMDDFDINVILGNLLLNACEAMRKCEKKELSVIIGYTRGVLILSVKNTYNGVLMQENGRIMSTKEEAESHGIGLASIRRTVKKYGGDMEICCTPEEFKVKVLLFVPPAGQAEREKQPSDR